MGHNSVISGYLKCTGIPRINGLSMRPPNFQASQNEEEEVTSYVHDEESLIMAPIYI